MQKCQKNNFKKVNRFLYACLVFGVSWQQEEAQVHNIIIKFNKHFCANDQVWKLKKKNSHWSVEAQI